MASKPLVDVALKLYKSLGGNLSKVLGTRSNVNFLGKTTEPSIDMDINPEAFGAISKSKVVDEFESAMGYLTSNKLDDIQANRLIQNLEKANDFYNPAPAPASPANITDFETGIRNLDQEGLMSLRAEKNLADDLVKDVSDMEIDIRSQFPKASDDEIKKLVNKVEAEVPKRPANYDELSMDDRRLNDIEAENVYRQILNESDLAKTVDDLPPPGSRGGPDDIAAPFTGAGLESLKKVQNFDRTIGDDLVNKVYDMAGVLPNAKPVARGNARDFLNTIKDLEDPSFPGGPTLSSVMELDDLKFMTEGGGGALGDPLLLVQKYFGPKVSSAVAQLDGRDQIELFAKRLVRIKDAKGNTITDRGFDPTTADFDFADGGRVGFMSGRLVGKALGMAMKAKNLEKGVSRGYADMRKYGIQGEDITNMFKEISTDPTLVGKEKTEYFKVLNQALKNPEQFPDTIKEIQMKLGIDIGTGFRSGGLAKILEV